MNPDLTLQTNLELNHLNEFVVQTCDVAGDCAEVGVYLGGSALEIYNAMDKGKKLYLFDTFTGFEDLGEFDPVYWSLDKERWETNGLVGSIHDSVVKMFKDKNAEVIKGNFPSSIGTRLDKTKFSFVHLDADAYVVTKNSLEYFYLKMSKGGIILFHDYYHNDAPIRKVCDEFFHDKPEKVIQVLDVSGVLELKTSQGYIIKQ